MTDEERRGNGARPRGAKFARACTLALVVCLLTPAGSASGISGPSRRHASPSSAQFSIAGHVAGLFPGAVLPMTLTVSNPLRQAISVTSVVTTVVAGPGQCAAANVTVSSYAGALRIARHGTGQLTVSVAMSHLAPNTCQGATFLFSYRGSAAGA